MNAGSAWSRPPAGAGDTGGCRLPEITEAARLELGPRDRLVIRLATQPDRSDVARVTEAVRAALGLPGLRVLVTGPRDDVTVLRAGD